MKVAAQASGAVYRYSKKPVKIGELRHKAWGWLVPPAHDLDPVWSKRCQEFWELQQETYGLVFSNYTMVMDWEAHVVITYAAVLDVLPGERRVDYVVPRVAAERRSKEQYRQQLSSDDVELRQAKDVDPAKRACPSCGGIGLHLRGCVVVSRSFQ